MSGIKLVSALLSAEGGARDFYRLGVSEEWLQGEERELFTFVSAFIRRHGAVPSRAALRRQFPDLSLPKVRDPPSYYADRVRERWVHREARRACLAAQELLNSDKPVEAMQALRDISVGTMVHSSPSRVVDYATDAEPMLVRDWQQRAREGKNYGVRTGWRTLDKMTGGLVAGDMLSIIGRPAQGKTWLCLFAALNAWRAGKVPMFVSMEMKPLALVQRVAAMDSGVHPQQLRHHEMVRKSERHLRARLVENRETGLPFWIIDGSLTATVPDILMYAQQLRPDVVLIDGAYLVRSDNQRAAKWERTSGTAERIKSDLVEALGLPTVLSYQFNREAAKNSKKRGLARQSAGLEDIAFTDSIAQLSSIVLGLLQDESIETEDSRLVSILKGRSGEQGSFSIRWDFRRPPYCDFSEIKLDVEKLSYGGGVAAKKRVPAD